MSERTKFAMGAFGVVLNEKDEVLLVHRTDYDFWNLPGGAVESGESPWKAVVREVKEETGFDVEVVRLTGLYFKETKDDFVCTFLCKITGGQKTLNDEARAIEFFSLENFPKNTNPASRERSEDALKKDSTIFMRVNNAPGTVELLKQGKNPF